MRLQSLMHDHGIPTPKVYGWIDDPTAYVMDRVGGAPDFSKSTDEERRSAVDDYLHILARLHALDITPFVEAGIMRAARPEESGTFGMSRYERVYRSVKVHPDPFLEFCEDWMLADEVTHVKMGSDWLRRITEDDPERRKKALEFQSVVDKLFSYGGTLTDNGLVVGTVPTPR